MGNPINVFVYGIQGQVRKVTERTMIFKKKSVLVLQQSNKSEILFGIL